MISVARTDKSLFGRWWWTVDRWSYGALLALSVFGIFMVAAASPPVAERLGLSSFHFLVRHFIFLVPSLVLMTGISLLSPKAVRRLAGVLLLVTILFMALALGVGTEIKGAKRWIHLFGFSLQPSEFIKPAFAVTAAWLIAHQQHSPFFPGYKILAGLYAVIASLLILQPDFGMTFVVTAVLGGQVFLAGLPLSFIVVMGGAGVLGIWAAYSWLPHVTSRIDRFLDPATGDNYQVQKSLDAFGNGGLLGTGPAHGQVKMTLPDAHADFIFAVTGEELGLIAALIVTCVFLFIILRGFARVQDSGDMFVLLAVSGLLVQFGLQTLIHMGSSLQLLPAKGMTLPFVSYGGSSLMALAIGMGMVLALTRKQSSNPYLKRRAHAGA